MLWLYRNKNANGVGTNGIHALLNCLNVAQDVEAPTGIVHISGNPKNKIAGPVLVAPGQRKEQTMNNPSSPPATILTHTADLVESFLAECNAKGLKPNTLSTYRKVLLPFGKTYNTLPSRDEVRFYCDKYIGGSRASKDQGMYNILTFLNWCHGTSKPGGRKPYTVPDNTTGQAVQAFLDSRSRSGLSEKTIRWYRGILGKFAHTYADIPCAPTPIEQFIANFKSSEQRRHGAYRAIKAFYSFLVDRNGWTADPTYRIHPPRCKPVAKVPLTLEQTRSLLDYPGHDPDVRLLLFLLVDTGCRIGEAVSLTSNNILADSIKVSGKTGERIVPIRPQVRAMLLESGKKGKIFPRTLYRYRRLIALAFKEIGIPGTAHLLRHTAAACWDGSDLALKTIGGWKSWKMVEHYAAGRRIERAKEEHRSHGLIAKLYGNQETVPATTSETYDINKCPKTINLIVNNPAIFQPEPQEWPIVEINGKEEEVIPFIALSIIPAIGWHAVFANREGIERRPLACFALVKDWMDGQSPAGMCVCNGSNGIVCAEDDSRFLGYDGPGEFNNWTHSWLEWLRENTELKGADISMALWEN